jgi:hypothetical protein
MGCDIHAYVEYTKSGDYWWSLTDNAGHRNYRMFAIMAGVRDYGGEKLFDAKGLPDGRMSFAAEGAHWLLVAPDATPEWAGSDGWVSKASAERWIAEGSSEGETVDGILKRVTNPDHHSHSWLTTDELSKCVDQYRTLSDGQAPTEWVAILAAMKAIEGNGEIARVVFWFDN